MTFVRRTGVAALLMLALALLVSGCGSESSGQIVWGEIRAKVGNSDTLHPPTNLYIHVYDLPSGRERPVRMVADQYTSASGVSGDWVVWVGGEDNGPAIYGLNLASGEERDISTAKREQQMLPAISGEWVVWQDMRHSDVRRAWDIYAYDMTSGEERPVCRAKGNQGSPAVSGEWVVWADDRRGEQKGHD